MFRHTLAAAALALAGAAHADVVRYQFPDIFTFRDYLAPTSTAAHLQASHIAFSGAFGLLTCETFFDANGFACGSYGNGTVSFSVSAEPGWQFDVNGFSFQGLGPEDRAASAFAVFSSLDGFAQPLYEGDLTGLNLYQRYNYDVGLSAQGLRGPLELRISMTGAPPESGGVSQWYLDNVTLDVTVRPDTTVPEPGTLALGAVALLAAVRRSRSARAGRRGSARPARG